jgi:very-short-patch-repair endonuclease
VVGDTKQLPPTSFFDRMVMDEVAEEDEEAYSMTSDMPSILSLCNAQRAPERMLRWHYRSRHESLIAVSNYEFYDSRLVVFPSPGAVSNLGLVLHYLPDTAYDRGKSRTNKLEAEAVANAVMEHAARYPGKTLGVVAFSEAQKGAVMDAIELRRKASPQLEPFFSTAGPEPFFVKNLESVQGDERDVIMISVGYGKDASGYLSMSFGPLNNDGGEKRLNVLITRAKERCEVFTNLTHDDIDLNRTKGQGVKAFKTVLKYAATGIIDIPQATGKEADSPFEEAVCNQLEGLGYTVHQQVGSNGFFIDLAVVDPQQQGRYILGIECDGASYHAARSARDRDRLRQNALEGMGWTFHRIWSTDWFRHPDVELKRLVEAIEKARVSAPVPKADSAPEQPQQLERQAMDPKSSAIPKYILAKLPGSLRAGNDQFHLHSPHKMAGWLEQVVRIESPVHIDEAARRLVEAAGLSKVGSRIRAAVEQAVEVASQSGGIRKKGDFLWSVSMSAPPVRDRSELPASSRKMQLIAPEEIKAALVRATTNAFAISEDALVADCGRMFGFARVTEEMRETISQVVKVAIAEGRLLQEGNWIKPAKG